MLHGFTEYTGEQNRPLICRVCFVSFFEEGANLGRLPLSRTCTNVQLSLENQATTGEISWLSCFKPENQWSCKRSPDILSK